MNCDTLLFICESASSWWNIFVANKKWWKLAFRSACNGCSILRWIQYLNDFKGIQFRTGPFIKWLCVFRAHQNSRWVRTWRCMRLSAPSRWLSRFSSFKKRKILFSKIIWKFSRRPPPALHPALLWPLTHVIWCRLTQNRFSDDCKNRFVQPQCNNTLYALNVVS